MDINRRCNLNSFVKFQKNITTKRKIKIDINLNKS